MSDPSPAKLYGVMNLNKPAGMTSRQALDVVKRLARPAKTGHAGTLDPIATGVLVVCLGSATRLIEYVQQMRKTYQATFLLGCSSPTEDIEGEIMQLPDAPIPTVEQIIAASAGFVGRIEQRPPAYSALKVHGRRAYDLARLGRTFELKPRPINIYRIELVAYEYPKLVLDIECGSGTYIRSLGRDLAESLGTSAVMSGLIRTQIGGFRLSNAVVPEQLTPENWKSFLQPALCAVESLPRVLLSSEEIALVRNGMTIEKADIEKATGDGREGEDGKNKEDNDQEVESVVAHVQTPDVRETLNRDLAKNGELPEEPEKYAAVDASGELVAILIPRGPGLLRPLQNLT